jgi:hypothetical protein
MEFVKCDTAANQGKDVTLMQPCVERVVMVQTPGTDGESIWIVASSAASQSERSVAKIDGGIYMRPGWVEKWLEQHNGQAFIVARGSLPAAAAVGGVAGGLIGGTINIFSIPATSGLMVGVIESAGAIGAGAATGAAIGAVAAPLVVVPILAGWGGRLAWINNREKRESAFTAPTKIWDKLATSPWMESCGGSTAQLIPKGGSCLSDSELNAFINQSAAVLAKAGEDNTLLE